MNPFRPARTLSMLALITALASPARADAGVPMLAVTWPGMLIALVPIVLIEARALKSLLQLRAGQAVKVALFSNLASTIVGIPLTWFFLMTLEMLATHGGMEYGMASSWQRILAVTVQAPWLGASEADLYWMIPTATLVLLPAYFLASWGIEYWVIWALLPSPSPSEPDRPLRRATCLANLASYALLAVLTLLWLVIALIQGPPIHRTSM